MEALELEDTIKNYERRDSNGWFVITSPVFYCFFALKISCQQPKKREIEIIIARLRTAKN